MEIVPWPSVVPQAGHLTDLKPCRWYAVARRAWTMVPCRAGSDPTKPNGLKRQETWAWNGELGAPEQRWRFAKLLRQGVITTVSRREPDGPILFARAHRQLEVEETGDKNLASAETAPTGEMVI